MGIDSNAATIFDHATRLSTPVIPGDYDFEGPPKMIVPAGYAVRDLEGWKKEVPGYVDETIQTDDLSSFIDYLKRYTAPYSVIFAAEGPTQFVAVLDYHQKKEETGKITADRCEHRLVYSPKTSLPWQRWLGINKKSMGQVEFARFLEDNHNDVVAPSGADLLSIVNTFKVEGSVTYSKAITLQNGNVRFTFNDERRATGGINEMDVPERFTLGIPVYHRGTKFQFDVKLRYKVDGNGNLALSIEMVNHELVVQAAFDAIVEHVRRVMPSIPVFIATRTAG